MNSELGEKWKHQRLPAILVANSLLEEGPFPDELVDAQLDRGLKVIIHLRCVLSVYPTIWKNEGQYITFVLGKLEFNQFNFLRREL